MQPAGLRVKTNPGSPQFCFTRVIGIYPCEQSRVEPELVYAM